MLHEWALHASGSLANLKSHRPISNWSVLSRVLEGLVNDQLKELLSANNILSFRNQQGNVTASLKVVDDLFESLDHKKVRHSFHWSLIGLRYAWPSYHEATAAQYWVFQAGCWLDWKLPLWKDTVCQIWCHFLQCGTFRQGSPKAQFWISFCLPC